MDHAAPRAEGGGMIDVRIDMPLARFDLRVQVRLGNGVTALMGPSGSGKTSLLEAIAGLRGKAKGLIALDGHAWLDTARRLSVPPEARRVGYVPQDAGLFPHLTVAQNVRFGARGEGALVETAMDALELRDLADRYPVSLSGGEKQRVALARALAIRPRLLLLDEPLAALDVALRERVLPYLVRIRDEWNVPCVYVTHNVGEAVAIAERLIVIREGKVEADGAPMEVLALPAVAREAERGIENLFSGHVVAHDSARGVTQVRLSNGLVVAVPLAGGRPEGSLVTLAIRAEDLLVAVLPIRGVSARNVYAARVVALERTGVDVTLQCALSDVAPESRWLVRVTPAAVDDLALAAGTRVWLAIKSHSVRLF
jgi:molybdate transport system ATP-binding protein